MELLVTRGLTCSDEGYPGRDSGAALDSRTCSWVTVGCGPILHFSLAGGGQHSPPLVHAWQGDHDRALRSREKALLVVAGRLFLLHGVQSSVGSRLPGVEAGSLYLLLGLT